MNLKKVKIGAHTYEVIVTKDNFETGDLGQCDVVKQKIIILEGLSES